MKFTPATATTFSFTLGVGTNIANTGPITLGFTPLQYHARLVAVFKDLCDAVCALERELEAAR